MIARLSLAAVFAAALALSACGKLGELDQPPPMFGAKAKADYAAAQAQHQTDAARARANAAANPSPDDPTTVNSGDLPLQQAPYHPPIPGREDPYGPTGPVTALPQPGQPAANQ